ncbi:MAG: phosphate ABC transporter permease PstA [Treponema sp.]|jgi:phosphate transport system permease protein|nr:phosphate ABC transporter permease PstA [Treponema sp.]
MKKKRKAKDAALYGLMAAVLVLVLGVLAFVIGYILKQSAGYLNFSLFTGTARESILPMIVTTFYVMVLALAVALPIGILTAVFLNEYSGNSFGIRLLRIAIETLAGIPSILYGLFGLLMFCRFFKLGQSVIAGALTLSIMILPVIIRTTEEALKTIPDAYREGSLSLGAAKYQTIFFVVIPSALPGIAGASILAAGRVVGESAPVLLTVGITRNIPGSIFESGRTLTVHLYYLTKEAINPGDFGAAFATAAVLVIFVIIMNTAVRIISGRFRKNLGGG